MKKKQVFSDTQLENLWTAYNKLVHTYITSNKIKNIDKMFEDISEQMTMSPCSTRYHGNYMGGLLEHLIDVIGAVIYVRNYFVKMKLDESKLPSIESCVFVAAFHDLGKIGDVGFDQYVPETSEWHRKTLNQKYKMSQKVEALHHSDGSAYLLAKYNIPMSRSEFQAIISHDGAYHPKNRIREYEHKVELLTRIVREADMLSLIYNNRKYFTDEELRN